MSLIYLKNSFNHNEIPLEGITALSITALSITAPSLKTLSMMG
jgi:hypothetical protein